MTGRIYDNNTGLTWEKKSDDDDIHDKDNTYTWEEALAYVKMLNNICPNDETLACATYASRGRRSQPTQRKGWGRHPQPFAV